MPTDSAQTRRAHRPQPIALFHLVKMLRNDLDRFQSSYAVRVITPRQRRKSLEAQLSKALGKRRAELLRVESDMQMLHRLRGDRHPLEAIVKEAVTTELALSSPVIEEYIEAGHCLDSLVLTDPDHPYVGAYQAGLRAFAVEHPYRELYELTLPVDLRVLYVVGAHELPQPIIDWLTIQQQDDLLIHLFTYPVHSRATPANHRSESAAVRSYHSFEHPEQEHQAIIQACVAGDVDTVFCATHSARAMLEVDCLLHRIPYHSPSMSSVISSETVDALAAYLDWVVAEEDQGLWTLLNMAGTSTQAVRRFLRARKIRKDLSIAVLSLASMPDDDSHILKILKDLAELVFDSRMTASAAARLRFFGDWAAARIMAFDRDLLEDIIVRSGVQNDRISLAELKAALYHAVSDLHQRRITILSPATDPLSPTDRAWLALGSHQPQVADRLISAVAPHVSGSMVISDIRDVSP